MLSPRQQAAELINKSQNILIVLPKDHNADCLGTGLALTMLGQDLGKKIDFLAQEPIQEKLLFLPGLENVKNEILSVRDFIISIDTSQKPIKQLRYETKDSILKIYLGTTDKIEEKDIKLEPGPFIYDAVAVIGAPDLETLSPFYEKYTDLFFEKSILNIDYHSANEYFGEVNLVEPTASSCAEIVAGFLNSFFPNQITQTIATCLLAGIIAETQSFQKINTTPQTFNLASLLIANGAQKEQIIQALYKTKPLNSLKLWGRLLNRLDWQEEKKLAWTEADTIDFEKTNTSSDDLYFVLEEMNELLPQSYATAI
ncbi:MAG: hypothetical protein A2174_03660, partial [Candidatus Portnoybacteria bacterium RBG_13_41_18]